MGFPEKLRSLRVSYGFTQEELAEKIKQTKANISKYENGRTEPSIDILKELALIFDTTVDDLLGLTNDPTPYASDNELTPREHLEQLFNDPHLQGKELAFKDFDSLDDDDINAIIEYIEARYLLAEKRKKK